MEDRFHTAVEAIYDTALDPVRWPATLEAIADVFRDVGTVLAFARDDGSVGTIVSPALRKAQGDFEKHWSHRDIRTIRSMERGYPLGVRDAITDRHVVTEQEIASQPIYREFLIPHGLGWFAGIAISPDPNIQVWISVQRSMIREPFSDQELTILTKLGAHAEKSLRLSIRLLDAELAALGLGDALTRIDIAVFALDSLGGIVFSNPAARRLPPEDIGVVQNRLKIAERSADLFVQQSLQRTSRADRAELLTDPKPVLLPRKEGGQPLVLYVLPITAPADRVSEFLANARLIVLVIEPKNGQPPDPAVVRDALGLTLGEARVAALIGTGISPRDAAATLRITEDSARTILKRVFSKVGISRQSELAILLTKLVMR